MRRPLGALHNEELVQWELDAGSQTLDLRLELIEERGHILRTFLIARRKNSDLRVK